MLLEPKDVEALLLPLGQQLYLRQALIKLGALAFQSKDDVNPGEAASLIDSPRDEQSPEDPLLAAGKKLRCIVGLDRQTGSYRRNTARYKALQPGV